MKEKKPNTQIIKGRSVARRKVADPDGNAERRRGNVNIKSAAERPPESTFQENPIMSDEQALSIAATLREHIQYGRWEQASRVIYTVKTDYVPTKHWYEMTCKQKRAVSIFSTYLAVLRHSLLECMVHAGVKTIGDFLAKSEKEMEEITSQAFEEMWEQGYYCDLQAVSGGKNSVGKVTEKRKSNTRGASVMSGKQYRDFKEWILTEVRPYDEPLQHQVYLHDIHLSEYSRHDKASADRGFFCPDFDEFRRRVLLVNRAEEEYRGRLLVIKHANTFVSTYGLKDANEHIIPHLVNKCNYVLRKNEVQHSLPLLFDAEGQIQGEWIAETVFALSVEASELLPENWNPLNREGMVAQQARDANDINDHIRRVSERLRKNGNRKKPHYRKRD